MLAIKGNTRDTEICHVNSRDFPAEERLNEHQVYVREVFLKSKLGNVYFDSSKNAFDIKMQKCMALSSGGGCTAILLYVTTTILNEWQIVQGLSGKWQSEVRASTA